MKILTTALFILILAVFFIHTLKQTDKIKEQDTRIKKLKIENDSLLEINICLDKSIASWKEKADSLASEINSNDETIKQLTQKRNEKIRFIDSMDHIQLFGFFSKFETETQAD